MDEVRQHLSAEKDKFKQKILESLTELYFLRNDGLMCDFQQWASKEANTCLISNINDEDILSDQKFSQLLNPQFSKTAAATTTQSNLQQQQNKSATSETISITTSANASSSTTISSPKTTNQSADSQSRLTQSNQSLSSPTITPSKVPLTSTTATTTSSSATIVSTDNSHATLTALSTKETESATTTTTTTTSKISPSSPTSSTTTTTLEPTPNTTSINLTSRIPSIADSEQTQKIPASSTTSSKTSPPPSQTSTTQTSESDPRDGSKRKRGDSPTSEETTIKKVSTYDDSISPPPEKKLREESSVKRDESTSKSDQVDIIASEDKINDVQISTKQPEVVILDQRGDYRVSSNFSKKESPTRISKVVEPIVTPAAISADNQKKQIVERAKHEAAVTARIAELRKLGLWSAKRLPKLQEPARPKTHWDYLLEEMRWLSSDFDAERKWKRKAAKKCALMVYRYHQEKRSKTERAEREHLQHIKKLAASQAKEIRSFWSSIEKIVDFRQQTKLEETRKKAMGLHLNYILDQTSKFSNTCLGDIQKETKEIEGDYLMNQDGENAERKEPVINVSMRSRIHSRAMYE